MRVARLFFLLFLLGCGATVAPPSGATSGVTADCQQDTDCPASATPCRAGACREGRCGVVLARPGTVPQQGQQEGDCKRYICGVGGELIAREDPSDVPADDGNPCTREQCTGSTPGRLPVASGARCASGVCNEAGVCVGLEEIAVGRYHGCLRLGDGAVECWGANERGQVSHEDLGGSVEAPVAVAGLGPATALALGGSHSCALSQQGPVLCWGANQHGQLGDGGTADRTAPAAVTGLQQVKALAAGLDTTCALANGAVLCWGLGTAGQLGDGKRVSSPLPVRVALTAPVSPKGPVPRSPGPEQISVGGAHACAAMTNGKAMCWGNNLHGQLGDGTGNDHATPVAASIDDVKQVAAGRDHTCALRQDGSVWCWGSNKDGQLGTGDRDSLRKPARVSGLSGVAEVAAGNGHTCARTAAGKVSCWGWNSSGQVSSALSGDALAPSEITLTEQARQLSLGSKHSCARLANQSFTCWGDNSRRQLAAQEEAPLN